jgi:hypothetical protein
VAAAGWWAGTIVLAVEQADAGSRRWLGEATGDPEAWEAFTPWAGEGGQCALAAYLLRLAESMQAHGSALPVPGGRGQGVQRAQAGALARRLIGGLLAGDPVCQPR